MTRVTSAQLMLQYPQPGSADQCVCTDGSCISNVLVCDGVWQCEGNDEGSFCEPIYRFLSQNPNASMENSPLLMDLAFLKRKCVRDTETAEVRKTKDLSAPLQEHRQKHPRCGRNELTCDNGKCINCRFVCDGVWNYRKGEDEAEFCKPKKVPSAPDCDTDELMCTDGSCVKLYHLCDDRFDCADGADECKFRTGIDQCKCCMCLGNSRCLRWN